LKQTIDTIVNERVRDPVNDFLTELALTFVIWDMFIVPLLTMVLMMRLLKRKKEIGRISAEADYDGNYGENIEE